MEDVLRLLDDLQAIAVDEPRTIIGRLSYGLDKDEVLLQIGKVRSALPGELRNASQNIRESEKIRENATTEAMMTVETAKKDAERILEEARVEAAKMVELGRVQQERMVAESSILKLAKAQAEEIRDSAERESAQVRRGADQYAADLLSRLEANIEKTLVHVKSSRAELSVGEAKVGQAAVRPATDRIRV
jgi:cell division septum initiation protein DivIVA